MIDKVAKIIDILNAQGYTMQDLADLIRSLNSINPTLMKEETDEKRISRIITCMMDEMEIPRHLLAYTYLKRALEKAYYDISLISELTTRLYPEIAEEYQVKSATVERSIRHVIDCTWSNCDTKIKEKFLGRAVCKLNIRMNNGYFFTAIVNYLKTL